MLAYLISLSVYIHVHASRLLVPEFVRMCAWIGGAGQSRSFRVSAREMRLRIPPLGIHVLNRIFSVFIEANVDCST